MSHDVIEYKDYSFIETYSILDPINCDIQQYSLNLNVAVVTIAESVVLCPHILNRRHFLATNKCDERVRTMRCSLLQTGLTKP